MIRPSEPGANDIPPSPAYADDDGNRRVITARVHTVGCSSLRTVTIRGFRLSSGDGADIAGFDLGPSPEEHLLAAVGSSLAQTIAHVTCAHDLSIDRLDIELSADLVPDREMAHIAGRVARIMANAHLTSRDAPERFSRLSDDVLRTSPVTSLISVPITLDVDVEPMDRDAEVDDWQI